jgi:hypothetical protein
MDVVDPLNLGHHGARWIGRDNCWRVAGMTVGQDNHPRLLMKWEYGYTGSDWPLQYYSLSVLNGNEWSLPTMFTTQIQPPALEYVARDIATDGYGNTYVLWQHFGNGAIRIRVYNTALTAILTDSSDQAYPGYSGGISGEPRPMPAVSLSCSPTGVCFILFKTPTGEFEAWRWSRDTTTNVWDVPVRWRYAMPKYEVSPTSSEIKWSDVAFDSWIRLTRFRQWTRSIAYNPYDGQPRVLTVREDRSAQVYWLPPTSNTSVIPETNVQLFSGPVTILPAQNFP